MPSEGEPVAFRTAVEGALGMADLSWDAAVMNDYRLALRRMMEQYSRESGSAQHSPGIRQKIELLKTNKQILAPFVHMRDSILQNPAALRQIFESARSLIEANAVRAHYVVLVADSDESSRVLHEKVMDFLRAKYPSDSRLRDQLYARMPVFANSNRLISHFIPKGAVSAWIDWPEGLAAELSAIPAAAQKIQIQANRCLNGDPLKEEGANFYGTPLTQAVLLLLEGVEASGLALTGANFYVQKSLERFADFQAMAAEIRLVSSAA